MGRDYRHGHHKNHSIEADKRRRDEAELTTLGLESGRASRARRKEIHDSFEDESEYENAENDA